MSSAKLFTPITLGGVELRNRIIVAPMCQYSASDGNASDWHLMHIGQFSVSGVGLIFIEATGVTPQGRISPGCLGLWSDENQAALKRVVNFCNDYGHAKMGIQLAHAGRKGSTDLPWLGGAPIPSSDDRGWRTCGPSATPYSDAFELPDALDENGLNEAIEEKKMIEETQKIFKDKFEIFSTCVRVPVFVGHGEAIYLETEKTIDLKKLISNIKKFPGLSLVDKKIDGGYVTPDESAGEDDVFISRLRLGANKKTIGLWVVADNLRKGAALNTVQIAELIIKNKIK